MARIHTAIHESGHGFFWYLGKAPLSSVDIRPEPAMGIGEWEGNVDPGSLVGIDRMYAIMAAYAGPLAEAKLRLQETQGRSIRFDYDNNSEAFINSQHTTPGYTRIDFVSTTTGEPLPQRLLTASFSSDTRSGGGPEDNSAYALANQIGRLDVLIPLCRAVRLLLDKPAIWYTIERFAYQLEITNHIAAPLFRVILNQLFEEESALAAHDIWLGRGSPLWLDQDDWYKAQGNDISLL